MLLSGLIGNLRNRFMPSAKPDGDPRLLQALAAAQMAETQIRLQFHKDKIPADAQEKLDEIAQVRAMTEAALAADASGDLETLMNVADDMNGMRRDGPLDMLSPAEVAQFEVIDAHNLKGVAATWTQECINARFGPNGLTALCYALARPDPHLTVLLALLDAGADPSARVVMGGTALSAMAYGRFDNWSSTEVHELVKALVAMDAGLETRDDAGLTPLQRAVFQQNEPMTEALLRNGADANATYPDDVDPDFLCGLTLLHGAVMDPDLAGLLLRYGADRTRRNLDGETAAEYAQAMCADQPDPQELAWLSETLRLLHEDQAA